MASDEGQAFEPSSLPLKLEKVFGKTDFYLMQSVNVRKKATIAVSSS